MKSFIVVTDTRTHESVDSMFYSCKPETLVKMIHEKFSLSEPFILQTAEKEFHMFAVEQNPFLQMQFYPEGD